MVLHTTIYGDFEVPMDPEGEFALAVMRNIVPKKKLVLERAGLTWRIPLQSLILMDTDYRLIPCDGLEHVMNLPFELALGGAVKRTAPASRPLVGLIGEKPVYCQRKLVLWTAHISGRKAGTGEMLPASIWGSQPVRQRPVKPPIDGSIPSPRASPKSSNGRMLAPEASRRGSNPFFGTIGI